MVDGKKNMKSVLGLVVMLVVLGSTSCATIGTKKLVSSHTGYNDAVQLTVTREVLANIVRSRYSDPMQFIAVSAINAQFSVNVGGSAGVGGVGQPGTAGEFAGSVGYSDSPTITFVPQTDAALYKSLYHPFEIGEAIGLGFSYRSALRHPGWPVLSVIFSFASINGADDFVGGRYNKLYRQRIDALVRLLQLGATFRQVPEWDFDTTAIPKDKVTAEDMVDAFQWGMNFVEEEGGKMLRLARYRLVMALDVSASDDPEVRKALVVLGVTPGRRLYILRPPMHATPGVSDSYAIWVTPRSMVDVLNLATRFVDVPPEHEAMVPKVASNDDMSKAIPVVRIRSSKREPSFPYRIEHRGFWFYIDDTEVDAKMFLEFMVAGYSSRVGSKEAGAEAPQVVIPVGGG